MGLALIFSPLTCPQPMEMARLGYLGAPLAVLGGSVRKEIKRREMIQFSHPKEDTKSTEGDRQFSLYPLSSLTVHHLPV